MFSVNLFYFIFMNVFKSYDIRGISPQEINKDFAFDLGIAINKVERVKKVLIGRDMRETSIDLEESLVESFVKQGIEIIKIGLCSTPMFNILVSLLGDDIDLGVMITASHNPGEYNGFKITKKYGVPVGLESGLADIRDSMPSKEESQILRGEKMNLALIKESKASLKEYVDYILGLVKMPLEMPKMKIVIDAGNGMAGFVLPELLKRLPWLEVKKMYFDLNGNFPNHEANPLKEETLKDLQNELLKESYDLAVAFDGDGDRIGFLDGNGRIFRGDVLTAVLADIKLREKKGEIIFDTRASWLLPQKIESLGGTWKYSKVGHANIKKQMRNDKALFAGEMSMHFYYSELWNVESGIYTLLLMLKNLAQKHIKASKIYDEVVKYHHSGEINFKVGDKNVVLQKIKDIYESQATKKIEIDGLRFEFGDPKIDSHAWWFSIRQSNTEPLLRLNLEVVDKIDLEERIKELSNLII